MLIDKPGVVYCVTLPTGQQYIGVTTYTAEKRLNDHISAAKTQTNKFYDELNKYPKDQVKLEVIAKFTNRNEAVDLEDVAVKLYDTINNGLNTLPGGGDSCGRVFSDKVKAKMSQSQHLRYQNQEERDKRGITFRKWRQEDRMGVEARHEKVMATITTNEHRQKMSDKMKAVHIDNPELAKKQGLTLSQRYKDDPELKTRISKSLGGGEIEVLKGGQLVAQYPSMKSAVVDLNLNEGNARSVLKGKRKHTYGYSFRKKT